MEASATASARNRKRFCNTMNSRFPLVVPFPLVMCLAWTADGRQPNFLVNVADDQSPFDFKFYNANSELRPPHINPLAERGMVFDGAYHMGSFSGAVCTPSRHMIMTGRSLWHLPIGPTSDRHCPAGIEQNSLPAVFKRSGYATMRTCKLENSFEAANRLFEVRHDVTKRGGDDESGSGWYADQVLAYLQEREATNDSRPMLIYLGFSHPHDTRDGKPDRLAHYNAVNHVDRTRPPALHPKQPKLPPNWLPEKPFPDGHPELRDEYSVSGVWDRRDASTIRNELGRKFACAENIDLQVGRVLQRLESMGELENTYVIYTADHGIAIGRHGFQGKQNLYEHTWRVPMVMAGPGIKPGSRVQGNIYLMDLLATLCELAGIPAPETNEGTSFCPVLDGQQETVRDVLFGVYCGGTKPGMRSVRKGEWKLIEYDVLDGSVRETQLFNLHENPEEFLPQHHADEITARTEVVPTRRQTNLAQDPRYNAQLEAMRRLLLSQMRSWDDPYRLWNQTEESPNASDGADTGPADNRDR